MKNGPIRSGILCVVFMIMLGALGGNLRAQEFRATVTGAITDPNGAAVAGATVSIQNVETNVTATVTTNDEGLYTFPLLLPGRYKTCCGTLQVSRSVSRSFPAPFHSACNTCRPRMQLRAKDRDPFENCRAACRAPPAAVPFQAPPLKAKTFQPGNSPRSHRVQKKFEMHRSPGEKSPHSEGSTNR